MDIGVAEARRRFKEVLDHVGAGHVVQVTRRGRVVAVITSPSSRRAASGSFAEVVSTGAGRGTWTRGWWGQDLSR